MSGNHGQLSLFDTNYHEINYIKFYTRLFVQILTYSKFSGFYAELGIGLMGTNHPTQ